MKQFDVADLAAGACGFAIASSKSELPRFGQRGIDVIVGRIGDALKEMKIGLNVVELFGNDWFAEQLANHLRPKVLTSVVAAEDGITSAGLSRQFNQKIARVKGILDRKDCDMTVVSALLMEVVHGLLDELSEPMFLCIEADRRDLYIQSVPPFGVVVADKFPDASKDIGAATRCLALDEWTASVFHSMRVLEHGLAPLAMRFNVPFAKDSWHTVIRGIEDGIKELRNQGNLTEKDRQQISDYSESASQFRYFKDAWRNHVTHRSIHYDSNGAELVWRHVRDFMQKMAEIV
jgi:hypothetical protein